jgi:DNA-binding NarL/FixJ family response regulator
MNSKSILIFNAHSLLVGGVKSLLDASDQFVVASMIFTNDIALVEQIGQTNPDVIIMDDETLTLIEPERLVEVLRRMPSLRLIVLDREISRMDVYEKRELAISDPDHFIEALGSSIALSSGGVM